MPHKILTIYTLAGYAEAQMLPWRARIVLRNKERVNRLISSQMDLMYETKGGKPELDWQHIIIQRIDRYPKEFVEDHWPPTFDKKDVAHLSPDERKGYHHDLGRAVEADSRTYRRIMNRVKDAIDLSIKRVVWNYKTAIPTYYPRIERPQSLLPICLLSDEGVDMAPAVEKTASGSYLGHTVLPLDRAYKNARLVCRPDSDWLANFINADDGRDQAHRISMAEAKSPGARSPAVPWRWVGACRL